jgi:hypothetical protein
MINLTFSSFQIYDHDVGLLSYWVIIEQYNVE